MGAERRSATRRGPTGAVPGDSRDVDPGEVGRPGRSGAPGVGPLRTAAERRAAARAATRTRLIDAAAAEFAARRVTEVSVDDIAARAGFTKGAVYSNFASKTDLVLAVFEHRLERYSASYVDLVGTEPLHLLPAAMASRAQAALDADPTFVALLASVWAESVHDTEVAARFAEIRAVHTARLATAITARADESGHEGVDGLAMAAAATGFVLAALLGGAVDPSLSVLRLHEAMTGLLGRG